VRVAATNSFIRQYDLVTRIPRTNMTTAFVTGASGFIGSHLVESLLAREVRVRCLVRTTSNRDHLPPGRVEFVEGDLSRPETLAEGMEGADVVYHLAGLVRTFSTKDLNRINVQGTYQVARQCALQKKPPVLIVTSSIAAAGPARRTEPRRETDPPAPISNYGHSKRAAEKAAARFADRVPTTIVRPGIVFGPRDRDVFKTFAPIARFRVHSIPGYLDDPPLSLIHVSDLVEVMIGAAQRGSRVAGGPEAAGKFDRGYYFACAAEHPSYLELGSRIAKAFGCRWVYPLRIPEPMLWLAAVGNEVISRFRGVPDIFGLDKVREATAGSWACSGELARRELGCSPRRSLDERLRETADWYCEHDWLPTPRRRLRSPQKVLAAGS
jgi:nucleoside-diphosphate-sugar epimerase